MRIHALRHAMATAWLNQGVPIKVVSERLEHANISITLQLYGHLLPNMQADAADKMDAWLAGQRDAAPPSFKHLYPHGIHTNLKNARNSTELRKQNGRRKPMISTFLGNIGHARWDPQEWDRWAIEIEGRRQTPTESIQVMMEPTGTAWVTLGQWCVRRGWTAYLIKSQMVSDLRKFFQHYVKNDRVDAWTLAQIPHLHPTAPMRVTWDRPEVQALVRWTKRQHQLAQQIRRLSQGIQAKAEACVPGISALFPNLDTHMAGWVYSQAIQPLTTQQAGQDALGVALHAVGDTWAKRPVEEVSVALWTLIERACAIYGTPDYLDWDARVAEIQADWEILTLLRTQHQAAIQAARQPYETLTPERTLESLYGVGRPREPHICDGG